MPESFQARISFLTWATGERGTFPKINDTPVPQARDDCPSAALRVSRFRRSNWEGKGRAYILAAAGWSAAPAEQHKKRNASLLPSRLKDQHSRSRKRGAFQS